MASCITFETKGKTITKSGICDVTDARYSVTVQVDAYEAWKSGSMLAQSAFPRLSPDEREFIISGATPAEFKMLFGEEESD